jgi:peroxiredoxin (alkyl hydroperoxide reductase subunit C)
MKIKEGDKLPNTKVFIINMDKEYEHKEISTIEILNKEKIILFGLPGAFTPGCSKKHLPSFLEATEKLKEKNIRKVFCISINDPFVMEAWGRNYNLKDKLTLLADVKGDFTKNIGAEFIWREWGLRSKRYTMLLEAGVVKKLVEEEGKCELTAAENFLKEI